MNLTSFLFAPYVIPMTESTVGYNVFSPSLSTTLSWITCVEMSNRTVQSSCVNDLHHRAPPSPAPLPVEARSR